MQGSAMSESRFKRVMRWVLAEGLQPDEPGLEPDEHLGQWFLPDKRGLGDIEPDTALEKRLRMALKDHYVENDSEELADIWGELMQLSRDGLYKDWLQPPAGPVYRGMTIKPIHASKVLGLSVDEIKSSSNKVMLHSNGGIYQPISNLTSWTVNCGIAAKRFARLFSPKVSIILRAQCAPNGGGGGEFLMNPGKVPDDFPEIANISTSITKSTKLSEEDEVISHGPVRWDRAIWLYFDHWLIEDWTTVEPKWVEATAAHSWICS